MSNWQTDWGPSVGYGPDGNGDTINGSGATDLNSGGIGYNNGSCVKNGKMRRKDFIIH